MMESQLDQHPFSLLDEPARQRLQQGVDMAYFEQDDIILDAGASSAFVYVIHKGVVVERDLNSHASYGRMALYTAGDVFGAISVLSGRSRYRFQAEQQTLCYLIPAALFLQLCEQFPPFAEYFRQRLADKSRRLAEQREGGVTMAGFMLARISECMRQPLIMAQDDTVQDAVLALKQHGIDSVLIGSAQGYGIVTKTDLLTALVLQHKTAGSTLGEAAEWQLVTASPDDFLFSALVKMTRHRVARVVVMDKGSAVGLVELTDVLSFFSSRSYVVGLEIEKAESMAELVAASARLPELLEALTAQGAKMRFIMDLLSAMNGRIMNKAWQMVLPSLQAEQACLMVMGSEGRGEQIVKTDQDNGLILAAGQQWPQCHEDMTKFTEALFALGYPPCRGLVMVSNPQWVGDLPQWQSRIERWAANGSGLELAILADARAVAGDARLLEPVRQILIERLRRDQLLMAHFARPVLQFATPLNLLGSLKKPQHGINIKKAAIFPLVHGVRAMAMQQGITETSTLGRLEELVARGEMEASFAEDLTESLALFSELRLRAQLAKLRGENPGLKDNHIIVQQLSTLERDLLRDALHLINEFKQRLSRRFHLEY